MLSYLEVVQFDGVLAVESVRAEGVVVADVRHVSMHFIVLILMN